MLSLVPIGCKFKRISRVIGVVSMQKRFTLFLQRGHICFLLAWLVALLERLDVPIPMDTMVVIHLLIVVVGV